MRTIHDKPLHSSGVRDFFSKYPGFLPQQDALLNCKWSHRWFSWLQASVEEDTYTFQEVLQGRSGAEVMINDMPFCMLSSYDYLGLIGHADIEEAAIDAIRTYGTGTGGVRLLTGTNQLHEELEQSISRFKGTEDAMVLSSGYMANLAVVAALFSNKDLVIADEYIHRSIADAIRLAGITAVSFRHNDPDSLEQVLAS